jgi:hypothetical protein
VTTAERRKSGYTYLGVLLPLIKPTGRKKERGGEEEKGEKGGGKEERKERRKEGFYKVETFAKKWNMSMYVVST